MGREKSIRQTLWSGAIAHCEVHVGNVAIDRILSEEFLDGRSLMLARVAGIRAARRVSETFDLHAESGTGPVELDWTIYRDKELVLWQAHVSTWDGAFFPAASLLSATTAATALLDMIKEDDPSAGLRVADIREEAWRVGSEGSRDEEATQVYSAGRLGLARDSEARVAQIKQLLDAASRGKPRPSEVPEVVDERLDGRTIRDLTPPAGAVDEAPLPPEPPPTPISALLPKLDPQGSPAGALPLVEPPPPASVPGFGPPVQPVPSSRRDPVQVKSSSTPRGLIVLFVASLAILALALAIFGYVIITSM